MAEPGILKRADEILLGIDLDDHLATAPETSLSGTAVRRSDESHVSLAALVDLLKALRAEIDRGRWADNRPSSDAWLAPRLHAALRLDRSLAADKSLWHWVAVELAPEYVDWRWQGEKGVTNERWFGPIHKQSFARLWWGAEIFRDGADYLPVERAFKRQDLINSYLHRPLVRCRSFAIGIVTVLTDEKGDALPARQVNDLARVLNLCTSGSPPEPQVHFQRDDEDASIRWADSDSPIPESWEPLPLGPNAFDTTEASLAGGRGLAERGMTLAGLAVPD